ncbi:MAG: TRAP transporter substrate-binding protein [Deltaproteobacteria bacterium]|nr:TRAP transporter substrate-binding protein [Deltaproteobacteria bacterium]
MAKRVGLATVMVMAMALVLVVGGRQASAAETFKLKFAHIFPGPAKQSLLCEAFVKELEQRSGGRIKTQYFGGGSLLKPPGVYKGVELGVADMGFAHVEYTPGRFPVTEACDLPLGYPSGWVSNMVVNDFYTKFKPKEFDKVKVLWMHACSPNVMITTEPVRTLDDMKGLTIRAPGRVGETVKALGASPAPMPIMEVYDGLSKGVIQGVNTPFETLKTFRFAEVAKYVTSSWQVGNIYTFYVIMNKRTYDKLPPDLKEIVDELAGEYKEKFALMWNGIDFDGRDFAKEKGVEFISLDEEQVKKWKSATEPVIENYIKDMKTKGYSEEEIRGWISFLRDRIDFWTAKQMEYRIPSPTGPKGIQQ